VVEHEASIQRYFHAASAEEIYERLQEEKDKNAWAETAHKILHKKSPTSVKVQTSISKIAITFIHRNAPSILTTQRNALRAPCSAHYITRSHLRRCRRAAACPLMKCSRWT
jgi:signal-transduction protein with cAMP-binding, CBS, and nucleotidyltransferase domain